MLARHYKISGVSTILGALSVSMLFHGIYNLLASESGISSVVAFCLPLITVILVLLVYKKLQAK